MEFKDRHQPLPVMTKGAQPAPPGITAKPSHTTQIERQAHNPTILTMKALLAEERNIVDTSRALKAMAHPLRLKIMCLIGHNNEMTVQDIVTQVGTSQSNVSQHLAKLRQKNIVSARRNLNHVMYSIADDKIQILINSLRSAFSNAELHEQRIS